MSTYLYRRSHITTLLTLALSLSFGPLAVYAAADDVTLTTDASVVVGSDTLDISGSNASIESLFVDGTNLIVVLQSGSSIKVSSSDRKRIDISALASVTSTDTCTATESTRTISATASSTVYIAPSSDNCDTTSDSSSSSGGGGGGGGGGVVGSGPSAPSTEGVTTAAATTTTTATTTPVTPSVVPIVPAKEVAKPSPIAQVASPVFNTTLRRGLSNADVKRLQQLLNSDPDTRVAASGVGSSGNETNYYGSLTEKAVQKFQAKYGVVSSGTPDTTGYGLVGPKTRAKLAEVFSGTTVPAAEPTPPASSVAKPSPVAVSVSPVFNSSLSRGMSNADIKRLQQLLNSDPDTRVAQSGVGSSGNETNYFGSLTEKALQKFQAKYGIVSSGTPDTTGFGRLGPKTRAMLAEVFGSE